MFYVEKDSKSGSPAPVYNGAIVVVLVLSRPTLALRYGTDVAEWRRIQRFETNENPVESEVVVLVLSRPTLALRYGTGVAEWRRIQRFFPAGRHPGSSRRSPCFDWRRIQSYPKLWYRNGRSGVVVLVLSRPTLALRYGTDVADWRRIQSLRRRDGRD